MERSRTPLALSVIVMVPVRAPVAVGVNVTLIVQVMPAASDVPHVFVSPKSRARLTRYSNQIAVVLQRDRFSRRARGGLIGYRSQACRRQNRNRRSPSVPVSVANCRLLGSASVKTSLANSTEATEGVKVTFTVHDVPAGRLAAQSTAG